MDPNFSENFIDFVNRVEQSLPQQFTRARMVEHNGRVSALTAEYSVQEKKKLLGLMPAGAVSHCHEFRMVYAAPEMTPEALEDWWEFARGVQNEIVPADPLHEFSMISLILVAGMVDKAVVRKLKGKVSELHYASPNTGWSSVRIALVDLSTGKSYANRMGAPLRDLVKGLV